MQGIELPARRSFGLHRMMSPEDPEFIIVSFFLLNFRDTGYLNVIFVPPIALNLTKKSL